MALAAATLLAPLAAPWPWLCAQAFAQAGGAAAWPSRPIRLVVPFGPGAPDTVARLIGPPLATALGQPVVIENRPGANGVIGTEQVAKAAPDGHTLLVVSTSVVVNPSIYRKLPYDVERDLVPITSICYTEALILGVNPAVAANTVSELVALAKRPDSRLAFGSPGVGNTLHLAGELFKARGGIDMVHVPYKGAGGAIAALVANETQVMFLTPPLALAQIKAGKIRAIGYTGRQRAPFLPDVPTMSEAGMPDMLLDGGWHGLFAPAGTSPEIVARLNAEVKKALVTPVVVDRLATLGLVAVGNSSDAFRATVAEQIKSFAEMVRLAGITPE
jgi:tripartite-type tricarboxylate transporter receptor subunit TctC